MALESLAWKSRSHWSCREQEARFGEARRSVDMARRMVFRNKRMYGVSLAKRARWMVDLGVERRERVKVRRGYVTRETRIARPVEKEGIGRVK